MKRVSHLRVINGGRSGSIADLFLQIINKMRELKKHQKEEKENFILKHLTTKYAKEQIQSKTGVFLFPYSEAVNELERIKQEDLVDFYYIQFKKEHLL